MKLFNILTLLLILAIFTLPALAQDGESLPPETLVLPTVLSGLIAVNFKLTEAFKRGLESSKFGTLEQKQARGVLVIAFSVFVGIASAYITPESTSWLGERFASHHHFSHVLTGFSVSVVGSMVYEVLKRLQRPA